MMPLCSVIIPAYNCETTLTNSIRSAQKQTLQDIEILVVDDCSKDKTREIAQAIAYSDARVRVVHQEQNGGVALARNRGVVEAQSEWIAFLDSDDMWLPDKLERQFALAKKSDAELLYTAAQCINETGMLLERFFRVPPAIDYTELLRGNVIVCSSVLIRKGHLLQHPMIHSDLHEDYICWLQILADGIKTAGIPEALTLYRIAKGSKSGNKFKSAMMTWKCYKAVQLPFIRRCSCFLSYIRHGIRRYV